MNILIVYSDRKYEQARRFCAWTGKNIAKFDKVIEYSPNDIDPTFAQQNQEILSTARGAGLWLWKPYVIKKALEDANDEDIVFYADAGCFFFRDCKHIIDRMDEDIWLSDLPLIEEEFTKPEVFEKMGCKSETYQKSNQRCATFIGVRKSSFAVNFINEWLALCQDIELLSPESSLETRSSSNLISHREDQSILSVLSKKHGLKSHLDPSLGGLFQAFNFVSKASFKPTGHGKEYPASILLHKEPSINVVTIFKQLLYLILPLSMARAYANRKIKI